MGKLYCKLDELAKLRMSSMSWISCTVSWMSWLSCTVSLMSWISCTVSSMSWLSFVVSSVSLSPSHWYPGSGVVLDCIDS